MTSSDLAVDNTNNSNSTSNSNNNSSKIEDFRVIAGTYERLLYGLDGFYNQQSNTISLTPVFIYPSHISCIKSLASTGRFLSSGSTDEIIKIYDLKLRKEVGSLLHHDGSITDLQFFAKSTLLSAAEDGDIVIWRTRDWEPLRTLKGHKGPVHSVSIHPSGKICLSVGKDKTLKVWDLVNGKLGYSLKLWSRIPAEKVCWCEDGKSFVVLFDREIEVMDIESSSKESSESSSTTTPSSTNKRKITTRSRILCFKLITIATKTYIIFGGEDKTIHVYELFDSSDEKEKSTQQQQPRLIRSIPSAHSQRIKSMDLVSLPNKSQILVTCSTDGVIRCWDVKGLLSLSDETVELEKVLMGEWDAKVRLTCLIASESQGLAHVTGGGESGDIFEAMKAELEMEKEVETKKVRKASGASVKVIMDGDGVELDDDDEVKGDKKKGNANADKKKNNNNNNNNKKNARPNKKPRTQ